MSTPIELLWKQALKTFSGCESVGYKLCQKNFEKLHAMMNNMKAEDIKVDKKVLDFVANHCAPMCVIDVVDTKDITIAVFLLKNGVTLPMHDHPDMHGLLKVIAGTVKIDSFSTQTTTGRNFQQNEEINAIKHPPIIVEKTDPACVLSPKNHNLHEITCIEGPAAFLDILSPAYNVTLPMYTGDRPCTFFRQISPESSVPTDGSIQVKLRVTDQPPYFYSTSIPYLGTPLR